MWLLPRLHLPRRDYRTPGMAALDALANRLPQDGVVEHRREIGVALADRLALAPEDA
jgi:hypothetical protein